MTLGCRVSHMVGIPLLLVSLVLIWFNLILATCTFSLGCLIQVYGHVYYEHNKHVINDYPIALVCGIIFCVEEWIKVFRGR